MGEGARRRVRGGEECAGEGTEKERIRVWFVEVGDGGEARRGLGARPQDGGELRRFRMSLRIGSSGL